MDKAREATTNAEMAPDWERERFLYPEVEIFRASRMPSVVRARSIVGTMAAIAEIAVLAVGRMAE